MSPIVAILFVLLALTGLPLAIASGLGAGITLRFFADLPDPLMLLIQRMVFGVDSYALLAVPLFLLCGKLMNAGGITDHIFDFAQALVGHIPGGLAHANVAASMIFAGMSGASIADAAGLGQIEIKAMRDRGYRRDFTVAITAASATIGPIIPPSISMVIFAELAEESIGRLFLGGIIPGVLMGLALIVLVYYMAIKRGYPRDQKASAKIICNTFKRALLPGLTPVIIVGGIVGGVFTVTEAAAVATLYVYVLGAFLYKKVKLRQLPGLLLDTMKTTAVMMFILSTVSGISWFLITENVSGHVAQLIFSLVVLEAIPIMVLTIPVFFPLIKAAGIDPVHFGVVMVVTLSIGLITPPIGMILFVITDISELPIEELMRAIIPFVFPLTVVLVLIIVFPNLVLFIPNWLMP